MLKLFKLTRFSYRATLCGLVLGPAMMLYAQAQTSQSSDFNLQDVRGGTFQMKDHHSQPVLIAFLGMVPDTTSTPSLRETVFLSSMNHQYASRGLCVVAIDASNLLGHRNVSKQDLANASYDWHLNFPLLEDPGGTVAHQFGVRDVPTIFLIDGAGNIVQSWHGFTRPAVLAQTIESLIGGPLSRLSKIEPTNK